LIAWGRVHGKCIKALCTSRRERYTSDGQGVLLPPPGEDLLELRRENLLLEREKLSLEIAVLRLQKAKLEESSGETP